MKLRFSYEFISINLRFLGLRSNPIGIRLCDFVTVGNEFILITIRHSSNWSEALTYNGFKLELCSHEVYLFFFSLRVAPPTTLIRDNHRLLRSLLTVPRIAEQSYW